MMMTLLSLPSLLSATRVPFAKLLASTALCLTAALPAAAATAEAYVWWEAEDFTSTTIAEPVDMSTPGNAEPEQQAKLSGQRWLTTGVSTDGEPARTSYEIEVPSTDTYTFWVRKFWKHGPFRWRFADQDWQVLGRDVALFDNTFLQQFWGANWVRVGEVTLPAGETTFTIEMLENDGKGAIDCFLLTSSPFTPRGKLKPGEKTGDAEPGHFAWEPDSDPLDGSAPISLRYLNENEAGQDGFLQREGDQFLLADGTPVRFWMVQANLFDMTESALEEEAKRLAKYGVNLVRVQLTSFFNAYARGRERGFENQLDKLHRVVAALKAEGIYTYIGHLYWHTHNQVMAGNIPGLSENQDLIAMPYLSPEFKQFYLDYVAALLTPVNPETGVALKDEPALGFIEIMNESSLLFHTFNPRNFSEFELAYAERSFADWCAGKYGSIEAAKEAWGESENHTPDHVSEGRLGLYSAGFLGGAEWAIEQRNPQRAADQLTWMVTTMKDFYASVKEAIRDDIGAKSLVTASNWKTADDRVLGGLERYTYTATDSVLRNSYFATKYPNRQARQRFFAVEIDDTFGSVSALKTLAGPLATPLQNDYPFMVTENNWTRPNRFRAEWPVMIASYASLQGIDGWNFFAWDIGWATPMRVWDLGNPTILGQFPATALMYRNHYVKQADQPVVREAINLTEALNMQGTRTKVVSGEDAMWATRLGDQQTEVSEATDSIDPRAYFVGPVVQTFYEGPTVVESIDLSDYIDTEAQTVRSVTEQLVWDYDTGLLTIDTPFAQGATGFLKDAGAIELSGLRISSNNEYGSVLAVSLDGKPLAESERILIQTATEDKPYGFSTSPEGEFHRITSVGGYPLNVKRIDAEITLETEASKAIVLDSNGRRTDRRLDLKSTESGKALTLPADSIYTILE